MSQVNQSNGESAVGSQDDFMDEKQFNLVDGFLILLRRKKIIAVVAMAVMLATFVYGVLAERVYKVETVVVSTLFEELITLNMNNHNISLLVDPILTKKHLGKIYDIFVDNIKMRSSVKSYFNNSDVFQAVTGKVREDITDDEFNLIINDFYQQLNVNKNKGVTNISLIGVNDNMIGSWLDGLVDFVNKETVKKYIKKLKAEIAFKIDVQNRELTNRRLVFKQIQEDEIKRKLESYQIAKTLGIDTVVNVQFSDQHFKGTKILQAEMDALKRRAHSDAFIPDLPSLLDQKRVLESITFDELNLPSVMVKKSAGEYVELIKPRVRWMLALALALCLGVIAGFIAELISAVKKRSNSIS